MKKLKKIDEIRRDNARDIADNLGGNARFAEKIDRSTTQVSRFIGKKATKNIGDDLARHIERSCDLEEGWLDQNWQDNTAITSPDSYTIDKRVPVFNLTDIEKGHLTPFFSLECPVPHSSNTYAAKVPDNTMESSTGASYPEGSIIFVDPDRAKEARHGDLVIARMATEGNVTFKQLGVNGQEHWLAPLNIRWPMVPERTFEVIGLVVACLVIPN